MLLGLLSFPIDSIRTPISIIDSFAIEPKLRYSIESFIVKLFSL
jgi:hypothetical protein